ncbi:hypothetical protein [Geodermatophilus ruber]|nr:hypothetical protein [Geodermatophilus ruber]
MPSPVRAVALAALAGLLLVLGVPVAAADTSDGHREVGYDVSYPQCDEDLPDGPAFAIIGVNGGIATRPNPCLAEQLEWAAGSSGAVPEQPPVQLYVNTANPGQVRDEVSSWPLAGDTPYGTCRGENDLACSWQYGWIRAYVDAQAFLPLAATDAGLPTDPAAYRWWLDVETMNTWQTGSSDARARNRASLEGMTAYLTGKGGQVGVYSTDLQWRRIVGDVPPDSPLHELDSWLAGASTAREARATCRQAPLVPGGRVVLTQYVTRGLDHDHSCA